MAIGIVRVLKPITLWLCSCLWKIPVWVIQGPHHGLECWLQEGFLVNRFKPGTWKGSSTHRSAIWALVSGWGANKASWNAKAFWHSLALGSTFSTYDCDCINDNDFNFSDEVNGWKKIKREKKMTFIPVHLPGLWGFWDGAAASCMWNRNVLLAVAKGWFTGSIIGVSFPFVSSSGIFYPCSKQKIDF